MPIKRTPQTATVKTANATEKTAGLMMVMLMPPGSSMVELFSNGTNRKVR